MPAILNKKIVFVCNNGKIYLLNNETGKLIWEYQTKGLLVTAPVILGDYVYCGSLDKNLYALNIGSGELVWSYQTEGQIITNPAFSIKHLFVGTHKRYIYAFTEDNPS